MKRRWLLMAVYGLSIVIGLSIAIGLFILIPSVPVAASGNLTVVRAAVFYGYKDKGGTDALIVAEVTNTVTPYYNVADPSQYWQVQLMDTDNVSILGVTTLKAWGDEPIAIYLNANRAAYLTNGGANAIKVIATYTGASPASANYTLKAEDWRGDDLSALDKYVIDIADSMDAYYGYTGSTSLTTQVSSINILGMGFGNRKVLTEAGGVRFNTGIPALSDIRANLFQAILHKPPYTSYTPSNAYYQQPSTNWTTQVGSNIQTDVNTFGNLFSISGDNFLGLLIGVIVVLMAFLAVVKGGAAIAVGLLLAFPLVLYGNYLRVIDISMTTALLAICTVVFGIRFWVVRT